MPQTPKRIFLVNRDFQLKYTRTALMVGLVSTLLTVGLVLFPLFYLGVVRFPYFVPPPFLVGMIVASAFNLAIVTSFGIILTNRIAGPMFSLVRHLHQMRLGIPPSDLMVREADELKFVIRNVNEFLGFLNDRTRADLKTIDALIASLETEDGRKRSMDLAQDLRNALVGRLPQSGS